MQEITSLALQTPVISSLAVVETAPSTSVGHPKIPLAITSLCLPAMGEVAQAVKVADSSYREEAQAVIMERVEVLQSPVVSVLEQAKMVASTSAQATPTQSRLVVQISRAALRRSISATTMQQAAQQTSLSVAAPARQAARRIFSQKTKHPSRQMVRDAQHLQEIPTHSTLAMPMEVEMPKPLMDSRSRGRVVLAVIHKVVHLLYRPVQPPMAMPTEVTLH